MLHGPHFSFDQIVRVVCFAFSENVFLPVLPLSLYLFLIFALLA